MDFFDKLGKKASETYQVTKEKTVKFSEEMKLKMKINEEKNNITNLYKEIGELVYSQYSVNSAENQDKINEKCKEISVKTDEILKLENEILELRKVKKCVECGAEINTADDFCSKCGKAQPKVAEKVENVDEEKVVSEVNVEEEKKDDNKAE